MGRLSYNESNKMGKYVQAQRKGKSTIFKAHTRTRKGPCKLRSLDYAEKQGYIRGTIKEIMHDPVEVPPCAVFSSSTSTDTSVTTNCSSVPKVCTADSSFIAERRPVLHAVTSCL